MENWEIYDVNRVKKGRTVVRGTPFQDGDYHLVVHVCIFNSENQMLIQKRQPFKSGWSGLWDLSVGGSATAGENSAQAAERETSEEIGVFHDFSAVRPHLTINFKFGFDDYYLIEKDLELETLNLQKEEVEKVMWASESQILSMIEQGIFIPYHQHLIRLLFEIRRHYGAILTL